MSLAKRYHLNSPEFSANVFFTRSLIRRYKIGRALNSNSQVKDLQEQLKKAKRLSIVLLIIVVSLIIGLLIGKLLM